MKKIWMLFAILFTFTFLAETAHAKRLGSGKSFGKSYQTTPSRQQEAAPRSAGREPAADSRQNRQAAAAPAPTSRKGLMGGLLGGLLVGGLFAALFAGGAFESLQFMDFLIIGLLAFVLFKVIKTLRKPATRPAPVPQPAYAGAGAFPAPETTPPEPPAARVSLFDNLNSGGSSPAPAQAPLRLPPDFNPEAFLAQATGHYRTLQEAWNRNDLELIRNFTTPALFSELKAERARLAESPQTEILELKVDLVRADHGLGMSEISLRFSGRYRDLREGVEESFTDLWHLERNHTHVDAPWHLCGVESLPA